MEEGRHEKWPFQLVNIAIAERNCGSLTVLHIFELGPTKQFILKETERKRPCLQDEQIVVTQKKIK
jgi:hypothetical protein